MMMDKIDKMKGSPFDSGEIQRYSYKCSSCDYKEDIEDIIVDAFFYSQACKVGVYPEFTCPECNKKMKYIGF